MKAKLGSLGDRGGARFFGQVRVVPAGDARVGVSEQLGNREEIHPCLRQVRRIISSFLRRC